MCRKLIYLTSFVLVLIVTGNASAGLVAHWPLDEGSGTTAVDISGNGHNGTIGGTANWVAGQIGLALDFDGSSTYIDVNGRLVDTTFTLALWLKPRDIPYTTDYYAVMHTDEWVTGSVHAHLRNTTSLFNIDINGEPDVTSTTVLQAGEWYHFAVTVDTFADRVANLYVNGVLENTGTGGSGTPYLGPLNFGAWTNNQRFYHGLMDDIRIYDHVLSEAEVLGAMKGEVWPYAWGPNPVDGATHTDTWVSLSWNPGGFAVSHDVYLGDNFDDVNAGAESTFQGNQVATFFVAGFPGFAYPDGLVPGTTYYWRIDEVNDAEPNSPWKGDVWSLSIPPKTAYNPNPADGAELVALDAKLSWTGGFGAKLHTVYFGDNFDDVSNASGGFPQGTATYNPGSLKVGKTYYWRVDEFDVIDTHKGHVWSFTTQGAVVSLKPSNGAVDVKQTQILSWSPGDNAASHQVYFGTDKEVVRNADTGSPEYKGSRPKGDESYDPGKLLWNATYYWRVDEVNNANPDSPWVGPVWSFTTANFLIVDDFEDYDIGNNEIWWAWKDGLGYAAHGTEPAYAGNGTGSMVGDETTGSYCEETIVHGGSQSVPLFYDNSVLKYSEAEKTLTYPRDWTENGVNTLTIWFRGISANAAETLYVALNGSAVVSHDNPNAAQIDKWTRWNIDLQAFADQGVNLANINTIALGIGNKKNPQAGGSGTMYFDDARLYLPPEPAPQAQ
ncbi:MAG: LamG domain-containing protein [Sedimentisphaerales bacterium]